MNNEKIEQIKSTPTYRMLQRSRQKLESDFIFEAAMSQQVEQLYEDMMDACWRINQYVIEQLQRLL